jgi:TnpA family transposase
LLPRIDLPEVLLEVQAHTGFAHKFTHLSEGNARVEDLPVSICAALMAEACNIGLEPLVRPDIPALTHGRLSWVQQNYLRKETLTRANARLVEAQAQIPLAQTWGGGDVASADGLRFVVPVRTIHAGPNPKYFHVGRGVTYYNFTSDQFTGFHGIVIPGTLRDSLYILEGLLEQITGLNPIEIMSDTAGSLKWGTIRASELMRSLLKGSRPSTLTRALGELGRIAKTLYLLSYVDDENYRRRILLQLNRSEGRHQLARTLFHGQRGKLRQPYREGQEDQLSALGLVVNVVVLWNTSYMEAALKQVQQQGNPVKKEDIERLSPLGFEHVNLLGRYSFALPESVNRGAFRPLRNPEEED